MHFKTGDQVIIQNAEVPQGTPGAPPYFVLHEVAEYKAQYIVFASKLAHQQRVFIAGVQDVPERASSFVILPNETDNIRAALTVELQGLPLYVQKGRDQLLIINWRSTLPTIASGATNDRAELMERGRKVIDFYERWRDAGYNVPPAFRIARDQQNGTR